ncbi:metal-dependent hydrolase [Sulfitobacter pontiacus]|jgi:L-ascorbate metabolism protein UlaG (beta-lactamase superfamily)|uniref:metal-dependent hydrolase n=1 Tax=Sulfitobacter pontiacus TaxID=60137 RepID=UPI000C5F6AC9|nr:metal-dependent hydrolase [Sulfitobacter pontiacus]MAN09785.1 metal-dependent hydrolase [Roseobacter sp.]HJO51183.1 metal-dependent hydrolase [Sulfitobacter pontiacus]|tara:strand:- start:12376 stop:13068 length:693 start_codon:yes stop_codon:yes gene_type:complete
MDIIWLGHGSFRIEIEDQILLIDPWLTGNPMLDDAQHEAALAGVTQILVTHGHFDHTQDLKMVAEKTGAPVAGMVELMGYFSAQGVENTTGFNKGGTIRCGKVDVTMVPASHSSSVDGDAGPVYMGAEIGFMIKGVGRTIYVSGDTDIMADMDWMGDYHKPDIGILSAGGHFTMDMAGAAYAAKRYFDFKTVIPCHYRTFDALEQSAQVLIDGLPGVDVIEPEVLKPISL